MPSDERQAEELVAGDDAELEGQRAEDDRRVHVGQMVGGVDGYAAVEIFGVNDADPGAADFSDGSAPALGDGVLLFSGFVPERGEERKAAEDGCGQEKERGAQEIVCEPLPFGDGIGTRG